MERAVALSRLNAIGLEDLPVWIRAGAPTSVALVDDRPSTLSTLRVLENRYVMQVMAKAEGNKTAAGVLGIDRTTLYRKLEEIERETKRKA